MALKDIFSIYQREERVLVIVRGRDCTGCEPPSKNLKLWLSWVTAELSFVLAEGGFDRSLELLRGTKVGSG